MIGKIEFQKISDYGGKGFFIFSNPFTLPQSDTSVLDDNSILDLAGNMLSLSGNDEESEEPRLWA